MNLVMASIHRGGSVIDALRIGPSSHLDDVAALACGEPGRVRGHRAEAARRH